MLRFDLWREHLVGVEIRSGFYCIPARVELAIGAVLIVRDSDERIALVQKAAKSGYEFSGLWTFPGGMVRATNGSFSAALDTSLRSRVVAETGLRLSDIEPLPTSELHITSYHAKGARRFVLVLPFTACVTGPLNVVPGDNTVVASRCLFPEELGVPMGPANLIILSEYLGWRGHPLPPAQLAALRDAEALCGDWAREARG